MSYNEFISNILETRGRFACGDEYHEKHHIVPRCMGGTDDECNLIDLFAREHFEAHRLLALENPNESGLTYAWFTMCNAIGKDAQNRYICTPQEYEEARKKFSETRKSFLSNPTNHPMYGRKHSEEAKAKMSESTRGMYIGKNNPNYGNHKLSGKNHYMYGKHLSEETKIKLHNGMLGKYIGENNPNYGNHKLSGKNHPLYGKHLSDDVKRKISESHKGKILSEATKHTMSISHIGIFLGEKHPMYGKHHTDETKSKISEAVSGEKNGNSKRVVQYNKDLNVIKIWDCINCASETLNIHRASISSCCSARTKTAGRFIWRYLYDQTRKDGTIIQGAISLGLITEEDALKMLKT